MRRHPTAMHKQCIQIRGLTFICGPSKKKFNKEKNCVEDVNRELFKQNDKYIYMVLSIFAQCYYFRHSKNKIVS